jgi:hypothetical protein
VAAGDFIELPGGFFYEIEESLTGNKNTLLLLSLKTINLK